MVQSTRIQISSELLTTISDAELGKMDSALNVQKAISSITMEYVAKLTKTVLFLTGLKESVNNAILDIRLMPMELVLLEFYQTLLSSDVLNGKEIHVFNVQLSFIVTLIIFVFSSVINVGNGILTPENAPHAILDINLKMDNA